jgi:ferrous iron transport protein A
MIKLSAMKVGQSAIIHSIQGGYHFNCRATAMGITPETEVSMLQNTGHGPLLIYLRDTQVALGRGEAGKIEVSMKGAVL